MTDHTPDLARNVAGTLAGLLNLGVHVGVRVLYDPDKAEFSVDYGYAQWLVTYTVSRQNDGSWVVE